MIGRANGGMVVHLGVIILAVGLIAATTYRHQSELALRKGAVVTFDGHTFEFMGLHNVVTPAKTSDQALVKVDGGGVFAPATTNFGSALSEVGTPAIDSGFLGDVYLTFDEVGGLGSTSGDQPIANLPAGSVAIGVVIEPLLAWLWAGGLLIGVGGVLALAPGSRRRATDPVSAASNLVSGGDDDAHSEVGTGPDLGATEDAKIEAVVTVDSGAAPMSVASTPTSARRRPRHTTRWVAGGVLFVLCVVGVVLATRTPQEATQVKSPLLGHMAPNLTGTDLSTGKPVSLRSLRGHYVFVNFFASWCIPCQQETPDLITFNYDQSHTKGGADLVGSSSTIKSRQPRLSSAPRGRRGRRSAIRAAPLPPTTASPRHRPHSSSTRRAGSV